MTKTLLITTSNFNTDDNPSIHALTEQGYNVVKNPYKRRLTEDEIIELVQEYNPELSIAGVEPWTESVFSKASNLKALSRCGAGTNNVDFDAAKKMGVAISSTPAAPALSVAELTLGLILDALRKISFADRAIRSGQWEAQKGNTLEGKQVGLIGFGHIGQKVATLCHAFGAHVSYHDPYASAADKNFISIALDELIKQSDIISLHVPFTEDTEHMIGPDQFRSMKESAILINAARGGLIDEEALFKALTDGQIAGAALDVFEQEPYSGPLKDLDTIVMTAHMGSYARETRQIMENEASYNLLNFLEKDVKVHGTM